ncbi:MAG: hypothetical protein FD146_1812 [Anaerolineaceae bacterium]|nr:MAG: hypothetical protein FD146_1812 [Anaerolineaceae bacterium]
MRPWIKIALLLTVFLSLAGMLFLSPAQAPAAAQQPTGSVPTVTGTPSGPFITVTYEEQINVRAGPVFSGLSYPVVGVLLPGQTAPALGKTAGGEWIQIYYPGVPGDVGWVYAPLVSISPGFVPILLPPPTQTPQTTPTINPTLAAAFAIPLTPTRLPTFTPAPPVQVPTFTPAPAGVGGVPMGLVIVVLALIGIFGAVVSFLRGR